MNLASILLAAASAEPASPALLCDAEWLSFAELDDTSRRLARCVAEKARRGDRVAIVAGNEPWFVAAYLGTLAAGAVAVPLNPSSPAPELTDEMAAVGAVMVLATAPFAERARDAAAAAPGTPEVLVLDAETRAGRLSVEPMQVAEVAGDDLAVLLFTSGTGGRPKAAMLTHACLAANLEQVQGHPGLALHVDDVVLGVLPCFHVFGLNVVLGLALAAGRPVALADRVDAASQVARIRADGVTVIAAVPAMYASWLALDDDDAPPDSFSRVRLAVSGAAALGLEVPAAMRERFDLVIHEGYGLTEASPIVTTAAVDGSEHPGSIGPPLAGVEVRLVDVDGADALEGDPGEIWVRGPNVFAGYWGEPEATAAVLTEDGWLRTGDVAVADAGGWLTLVDRVKDLVIVSGFNVYPAEVEEALLSHPDVAAVAVVGEPSPRTGEAVVAFVVPSAGADPDPAALVRHAGTRLARYKLPARVEVVDDLPRSWGGKVLRRVLRAEAAAGPA
ncbi:MAG: AMP-binding protein [Acidimicrobiia bacterium]|nr:AMP-binding protein [Acidimicrobiia bacterium]